MAQSEFVSRVDVAIDGKPIEDMKNFKILKRTPRKMVELMKKTGFVKKTVRHTFSLDYVAPVENPIDFEGMENIPVAVAAQGGKTINYLDAFVIEVGDETFDGENESVQTILFGASGREIV